MDRQKTTFFEFEAETIRQERNEAHADALKAERRGKALARKAVRMADKGSTEERIYSPAFWIGDQDMESTTLALNAELKSKGHDLTAEAVEVEKGYGSSSSVTPELHVTEVEGIPVRPRGSQEA